MPAAVVGITLVVGGALVDTTDVVLGTMLLVVGTTLVVRRATVVEETPIVVSGLVLDVGAPMVVAGTVDGVLTGDGTVEGVDLAVSEPDGDEPSAA